MKVGADWIVYYLRARGVCDQVHNTAIGKIVSNILAEMGCPQNPKSVQIKSPVAELMLDEESGLSPTSLKGQGNPAATPLLWAHPPWLWATKHRTHHLCECRAMQ